MRVSRTGIDEIKRRNDLADVVSEHGIELKRRGRSYFGLCPFHEEKTASLSVSREAGLFHCFGCGAGGDVIGFVSRFHQISFREALERLASRAGMKLEELPEQAPAGPSTVMDDSMRRQLNESATERFMRRANGRRP